MRRLLLLFLPLVALSAIYFPAFCQSVPTPPTPLTPPTQIQFIFDQKEAHTKALQAVLSYVPASWLTLRLGSPSTGVWRVRVASSDAEWRQWRVRYDLTPDSPGGWELCGETLCEQNLILIRHTDEAQGVFAHECCHVLVYDHFTAADKDVLKSGWRQRMKRGKSVSGYAKTNWEEGTAEAFRCYVGAAAKPQRSEAELFRYFGGN